MARLRHVTREQLTIERKRRGRTSIYVTADGQHIKDPAFLDRVHLLGIPPAWNNVRVADHERAHIQALGTDAAGRIQYIYHPDWEVRRTRRKAMQLAALTAALPRLRRHVREDLAAEAGSKELALAIGVTLIDRTAMRVGRERYLDTNGTRGAGTLFTRDIKVKGHQITMTFPAKSGKTASYTLEDERLAEAIERVMTIPGKRLLMYRNSEGKAKPIRTEQLNAYLRDASGAKITAKDFRTLHASALAAEALAKLEPGSSQTARKKQVNTVVKSVAAFLQNTPAICRASYIAPCLFTLFEAGKLARAWALAGESRAGLKLRETRLSSILEAV